MYIPLWRVWSLSDDSNVWSVISPLHGEINTYLPPFSAEIWLALRKPPNPISVFGRKWFKKNKQLYVSKIKAKFNSAYALYVSPTFDVIYGKYRVSSNTLTTYIRQGDKGWFVRARLIYVVTITWTTLVLRRFKCVVTMWTALPHKYHGYLPPNVYGTGIAPDVVWLTGEIRCPGIYFPAQPVRMCRPTPVTVELVYTRETILAWWWPH